MLCVRTDRPLDPRTVDVLRAVTSAANALGLQWFVVGAMARDILLTGVFGLDFGRATRDVDLGAAAADWQQFDDLKQQLRGDFEEARGVAYRLFYQPAVGNRGYPLDLIPFGGVEGEQGQIAWPPDMSEIMNVAVVSMCERWRIAVGMATRLTNCLRALARSPAV